MRAKEFVIEKRKRKPRWAAYGPGPYGGYGYAVGYSGDGGDVGGESVGNYLQDKLPTAKPAKKIWDFIDAHPKLRWFLKLNPATAGFVRPKPHEAQGIVDILNLLGQKRLASIYAQMPTGKSVPPNEIPAMDRAFIKVLDFAKQNPDHPAVKKLSQSATEDVDEGWKDWVAGAGLAAMAAGGGGAAYDAYKASKTEKEPEAVVAKSDFKKGVDKIAKDAIPKHLVTGSPHEKYLTRAAIEAGIKGIELAQFLAQTAHESHNFKSMVEYGGSLDFKKYEPKFVKDKKTKKLVQVNPKAKTLGNTKVGDGARYKGRGYIQLTGRYNYKRAGEALGLPLEDKPELVEKPEVAAKVAIWFWQNRVKPKVDDFADTKSSTKPINPGLKGLSDRKEKFGDFKTAMK